MASTINVAAYSDALVVLGTAGIVVPIVSRLGFSPVLGFLGAGALLGPLGLGSLITSFPALFWFTVSDAKDVAGIAELGVVFLLFLIGLELSLHRLLTMRRLVFGLGALQVTISASVLTEAGILLGLSLTSAVVVGIALAMSSTAVVSKQLMDQREFYDSHGKIAFGVTLFSDFTAIIFLSLLPVLSQSEATPVGRQQRP